MRQIPLRAETEAILRIPVEGDGDFERLMRRLQAGLRGRHLVATQADIDALVRAVGGPNLPAPQRRARSILIDSFVERLQREGWTVKRRRARVLSFRQRQLPLGAKDEP